MPAESAAGLDDFLEGAIFTFAIEQGLASAQAAAHDFRHQQASALDLGDEALADNVTQGVGEAFPNLLGFVGGKESENTIDALSGIDRVQSAQDKVPGLRRGQ